LWELGLCGHRLRQNIALFPIMPANRMYALLPNIYIYIYVYILLYIYI